MKFFSADKKSLHAEHKQLKRQLGAVSMKCSSIDADKRTGAIGKFKVSLERCSCGDFLKRRKPCRHMYRLAFELGLFELDANKIMEAKKKSSPSNLLGCELSFSKEVPKDFVVVDFEGANRFPDSICQIGLVVVKNNSVTVRKSFLVCPPYRNFTATRIHGIKFSDVRREPSFDRLWKKIKKYFEGQTIAAYSLSNDLNYLFATLERYKIPRPNFTAFDVLENVRACKKNDAVLETLENVQLATVAKKLGLTHDAHDAASDALVTAQIQIYLSKRFPTEATTVYLSTVDAVAEALANDEVPPEVFNSYRGSLQND